MSTEKTTVSPAVYNVKEIAALLNINLISAYELTKRNDFPAFRLGRRILVPRSAFENWLTQQAR